MVSPIFVTLSPREIERADNIAYLRQRAADKEDRVSTNGGATTGPMALANHVLGARTEHVFRKLKPTWRWHWFSDVVNNSMPDFESPRGLLIDVKGIDKPRNRLILQKNDAPDWAYVLVDATCHPDYVVRGWLYGCNGQKQEYWWTKTGRPAFFVPHHALEDMRDLLT